MTAKKSGWLFFLMVIIYIGAMFALSVDAVADMFSMEGLLWLTEGIVVVPSFLFLLTAGEPVKETLALHKIRIPTLFLSVVYVALLGPLVTLCNAVTMLFTENAAVDMLNTTSSLSVAKMFFFVGILAPVCEECVFRGILYSGFKKNGTPLQAVLWTAVLFGLFHMNLNQMVYAIVLGVAFGLLREATGNIWAGIIGHMSLNSFNVFLFYVQDMLLQESAETEQVSQITTRDSYLIIIGVYLVIAFFATILAACVLVLIAKVEYGQEYLAKVWSDRRKLRVWSVPLWIGIAICLGLIILNSLPVTNVAG